MNVVTSLRRFLDLNGSLGLRASLRAPGATRQHLTGSLYEAFRTACRPGAAALKAIVRSPPKTLQTGVRHVIFAGDYLGDLAAFHTVRELADDGVAGSFMCSAATEEDVLTDLSGVIVDGPAGLAVWLNELANRLSQDRERRDRASDHNGSDSR